MLPCEFHVVACSASPCPASRPRSAMSSTERWSQARRCQIVRQVDGSGLWELVGPSVSLPVPVWSLLSAVRDARERETGKWEVSLDFSLSQANFSLTCERNISAAPQSPRATASMILFGEMEMNMGRGALLSQYEAERSAQ